MRGGVVGYTPGYVSGTERWICLKLLLLLKREAAAVSKAHLSKPTLYHTIKLIKIIMSDQNKGVFGGVTDTLGKGVTGVTNTAGDAVGGLGNTLGDTTKGLTDTVSGVTKGVGDTAKSGTDSVGNAASGATGGGGGEEKKQTAQNPLGL
ncbi:MAG: hypothetical protein LQ341_000048 [Variospora aurantia]|nr:MAG: hypothetical protein LQ341_000048 [Variospora aurantia]